MGLDPSNYASLKAEIESDPVAIGYSSPVASKNAIEIASLLGSLTGKGAATITLATMSRDDFLVSILPALSAMAAAINVNTQAAIPASTISKWDRYLAVIRAADTVAVGNVGIQYNASASGSNLPLLNQAVSDGLLTAAQAAADNQRTGCRAEVLWGPGELPTAMDVNTAMAW